MSQQKQLQDLNEDCLLTIFHKLSKFDYWRLRKVSRRFNTLITNAHCPQFYKYWREIICKDQSIEMFMTQFNWFLEHMHDVAEYVEINTLDVDHLKMLSDKQVVLPKVHTLKIKSELRNTVVPTCDTHRKSNVLNKSTADELVKNVDRILTTAFPNVERLIFCGYLPSTLAFADMQELKQLEVYHDDCAPILKLHITESLFQHCKLTALTVWWPAHQKEIDTICNGIAACTDTLEELTVSSEFAPQCLLTLSEADFPRLRYFIIIDIYIETWMDTVIRESLVQRIYRICSNVSGWCVPFPLDDSNGEFHNLQSMHISAEILAYQSLDTLTEYFPQLKEMQFFNSSTVFQHYETHSVTSVLEFLKALIASRSLEILGIPIKWIDHRFDLKELVIALKHQSAKRQTHLELQCLMPANMNPVEYQDLMENFKKHEIPGVLQISLQAIPVLRHWNNQQCDYIEFDLLPEYSY